MRLNEVINRFTLVSGLEPHEVSMWTPVCIDAMLQVKAKASKEALKCEESVLRLCAMAGVLAYYKYCLYMERDEVKAFTAGSVSITKAQSDAKKAYELWEFEKNGARDLLSSDDDFCFRGVRL